MKDDEHAVRSIRTNSRTARRRAVAEAGGSLIWMSAKPAGLSRRISARSTMPRWNWMPREGIAPPEHIWIALRQPVGSRRNYSRAVSSAPQSRTSAAGGALFSVPPSLWPFYRLILVAASLVALQSRISPQMAMQQQLALQQETSSVPSAESVFKEELLTVQATVDSVPGLQSAGRGCNRFHSPQSRHC